MNPKRHNLFKRLKIAPRDRPTNRFCDLKRKMITKFKNKGKPCVISLKSDRESYASYPSTVAHPAYKIRGPFCKRCRSDTGPSLPGNISHPILQYGPCKKRSFYSAGHKRAWKTSLLFHSEARLEIRQKLASLPARSLRGDIYGLFHKRSAHLIKAEKAYFRRAFFLSSAMKRVKKKRSTYGETL